jgi:hypothetical protein
VLLPSAQGKIVMEDPSYTLNWKGKHKSHSLTNALNKRHGGNKRHLLVAVYLGQMSADPEWHDVVQGYIDGTVGDAEVIDRMENRPRQWKPPAPVSAD